MPNRSLVETFEHMRHLFDQSRFDEYLSNMSDQAFGIMVTKDGAHRSGKEEFRGFLATMEALEFTVWDVDAQEVGDTGFVIFSHRQRQRIDGEESNWSGEGTEIFVRENDNWSMCGWHFNANE